MHCLEVVSKPSWILLKQGLLPSRHKQKLWTLKTMLHCLLYTLVLSLLTLNILKGIRLNKPKFVNRMISFILPGLNLLAKFLGIRKNGKHYLSLVENLKSDIFNIENRRLNLHIQLVERISGLLLRYFAIIISALVLAASVLPIVINTEPLIPCPIDIGKYAIFYNIFHLPFTLYFAINSPCYDILLMSLLGIGIAQLRILEERLINLEVSNSTGIHKRCKRLEQASLGECVTLHKKIIEYVENINTVLALPLFIQYSCGCFIICNAILQLTIVEGNSTTNTISLLAYTCVNFSQLAAYHWLGNEIMYKSNKVVEACYRSKWYVLDVRSQKCLLLLMERAKKPLIIQLYTIVYISLESLTVMIRWSYSLFALIKATYN